MTLHYIVLDETGSRVIGNIDSLAEAKVLVERKLHEAGYESDPELYIYEKIARASMGRPPVELTFLKEGD